MVKAGDLITKARNKVKIGEALVAARHRAKVAGAVRLALADIGITRRHNDDVMFKLYQAIQAIK